MGGFLGLSEPKDGFWELQGGRREAGSAAQCYFCGSPRQAAQLTQ